MGSTKQNSKEVIIIGPAHPLRGGLAAYDERLAKEFIGEGYQTTIYTFSLQYPSFLFPGTTQYSDQPPPLDIPIEVKINSVNPLNWIKVGNDLRRRKPAIIVVRYWLPFLGPCLGTILRRVKKNRYTKIICIADNILPHEKRPGDKVFTKYFLKPIDAFITMSEKVLSDLTTFAKDKPAKFVPHPLYDNFGEIVTKKDAREKLGLQMDDRILLFFGFIRKYKGLDILLEAMKIVKTKFSIEHLRLMIAGEFYEDEKKYQELMNDPIISDDIIAKTQFIPDNEVKYYLCAADCVIQPYRQATQSGVTPLAYHFEKPMIVTNVGGLASLVPHKKVGFVAQPNPESLAVGIKEYFELGEEFFLANLREEKKKYSWKAMVMQILKLAS
ncbi:MAG: glycosyltransferase [Ginsengibacter sp.]